MMSPFTKTFIDISIPILVFFTMIVVGLDLTIDYFGRVMRKPRAVVIGTLGQFVLLPLVAILLIYTLKPKPNILSGILLIAACPGGAISNFYVYLARSNTALSVTLTAVSCILAAITMPALMNVYKLYLSNPFDFAVFTTVYFLTQVPLVVLSIIFSKRLQSHRCMVPS